jgi:hypothetical protein
MHGACHAIVSTTTETTNGARSTSTQGKARGGIEGGVGGGTWRWRRPGRWPMKTGSSLNLLPDSVSLAKSAHGQNQNKIVIFIYDIFTRARQKLVENISNYYYFIILLLVF